MLLSRGSKRQTRHKAGGSLVLLAAVRATLGGVGKKVQEEDDVRAYSFIDEVMEDKSSVGCLVGSEMVMHVWQLECRRAR